MTIDTTITISYKDEDGLLVTASTRCGTWELAKRFISQFKENIIGATDGTPDKGS
jgi:hypothetical protein